MSYAPSELLELQTYLKGHTGLTSISLGIVGDTAHKSGYHLGKDRIYSSSGQGSNDYSVRTTRDKVGLTSAASAMDIGNFPGLRQFSIWLVKQCQTNQPGTKDIREIIYSPDGERVLRYDRERGYASKPQTGEADDSHRTHTHISWYRDAQSHDRIPLFKLFFEPSELDMGVSFRLINHVSGVAVVKDDADHWLIRQRDGEPLRVEANEKREVYAEIAFTVPWRAFPIGTEAWLIGEKVGEGSNIEAAFLLKKDVDFTADPVPDCSSTEEKLIIAEGKLGNIKAIVG